MRNVRSMVNETQRSFVESELRLWVKQQANFFLDNGIENSYSSDKPEFGNFRISLAKYLIDVCAWNNANCLDIQITHLPSGKVSFPTAGECESVEAFREKLDELKSFLKNNFE